MNEPCVTYNEDTGMYQVKVGQKVIFTDMYLHRCTYKAQQMKVMQRFCTKRTK